MAGASLAGTPHVLTRAEVFARIMAGGITAPTVNRLLYGDGTTIGESASLTWNGTTFAVTGAATISTTLTVAGALTVTDGLVTFGRTANPAILFKTGATAEAQLRVTATGVLSLCDPSGLATISANTATLLTTLAGALTVTGTVSGAAAAFVSASTPITSTRTDNTSASLGMLALQRGTGAGTRAAISTTGDAANGVASLQFEVGGSNRLTISSAGAVAIPVTLAVTGATTLSGALTVAGAARLNGSTQGYGLSVATGGANAVHIGNGDVDTGGWISSSGSSALVLDGGAYYNSYSAPNYLHMAKATSASGVYMESAEIILWAAGGLVAGNTFNMPLTQFRMGATTLAIGLRTVVTETTAAAITLDAHHNVTGASTNAAIRAYGGNGITSQTGAGVLDVVLGAVAASTDILARFRANAANKVMIYADGHLDVIASTNSNMIQGTGWMWTSTGGSTASGAVIRGGIYGQSGGTLELFGGSSVTSHLSINSTGVVTIGQTTGVGSLIISTTSSGTGRYVTFVDTANLKYNWRHGAQLTINDAYEIIPSTAVGGSTFTTPSLSMVAAGPTTLNVVTGQQINFAVNSSNQMSVLSTLVAIVPPTTITGLLTVTAGVTGTLNVEGAVSASAGGIILRDVTTNATTKEAYLRSTHYTNAEEPAWMLYMQSSSAANNLTLGGGNNHGNAATSVTIATSANNTTLAGTNRIHCDSTGNVYINRDTTLAPTATAGFLWIPKVAGVPTGAPSAATGAVAIVYDSTNNRIYIHNGSWRMVAVA